MATSVQDAITEFISIAEDALPSDYNVRFATIFNPNVTAQALLITAVHFTMDEPATLGPDYEHEEHYSLICQIVSAAGNDDETTRLSEVYTDFLDVAVAVANNPTLNSVVRTAFVRQMDYSPTYTAQGWSIGELSFAVDCTARVTSLT